MSTLSTPNWNVNTLSASAKRSVSGVPRWELSKAVTSTVWCVYPETNGSPGLVWKAFNSTSAGRTLNAPALPNRMSTRACWFKVGVEKSSVFGEKNALARFPTNMSKRSIAASTGAVTVKLCDSTWLPGPCASVIAAVVPPGGSGTGSPFTGLVVPVCSANVPSLPS